MDSLAPASSWFGLDLFKDLSKTDEGNVLFSPAGISTTIGMLPPGAPGATATQVQEVVWVFLALQPQACLWGSALPLPRKPASLDLGPGNRKHLNGAISGLSVKSFPRFQYHHALCSQMLEIPFGECLCPEQFCSVQSLTRVQLFVTPWTAARQASLSLTNSWSLLKLMSFELMMPSNHPTFCHPLLLLPSIFPSIRVFSNESLSPLHQVAKILAFQL